MALGLVGCSGDSPPPTDVDRRQAAACDPSALCAGSAKRVITPSEAHIAGVTETRLGGTTVTQKFHLGGFGIGPVETLGPLDAPISNEPASRAFHCANFAADCAEGSREHTWVRALYLSRPTAAGPGTEVLFVTLDAAGAGNLVQERLKAAIHEATGVPRDDILIGQTHSHAAADLQGLWGGVPQGWVENRLAVAAAEASAAARRRARRAELTYAAGRDGAFNSYRRPRVHVDATPDETLSVLQARDSLGRVLGTLVQYSAHPTSVGPDSGGELGRAVHADYVLGVEDVLEAATGGATALYYNGPIADASPAGPTAGDDDYRRVHSRGECLARTALTLLDPAHPRQCEFSELDPAEVRRVALAPTLEVRHEEALLPVTNPLFVAAGLLGSFNRYYDFLQLPLADVPFLGPALAPEQAHLPQVAPIARTLVSRVTIGGATGGLEMVTVPGEATNTFGQYVRGLAETPHMMLLGLTQNSFGYIIPEEEFDYVDPSGEAGFVLPFTGYEEFVSLGPLTAPLLRLQAYNPLFDVGPGDPRNLPPSLLACYDDPAAEACVLSQLLSRVDYIQRSYEQICLDNLRDEAFCGLLDPATPLEPICRDLRLPDALCDAL